MSGRSVWGTPVATEAESQFGIDAVNERWKRTPSHLRTMHDAIMIYEQAIEEYRRKQELL